MVKKDFSMHKKEQCSSSNDTDDDDRDVLDDTIVTGDREEDSPPSDARCLFGNRKYESCGLCRLMMNVQVRKSAEYVIVVLNTH